MTLTRKDAAATALTLLIVLTFVATHESWGIPLVGSSHRWAAAAIALLGLATCAFGLPGKDQTTKLLQGLGTLALLLTLLAVASGSPAVMSLLVADVVVLWAVATLRHAGLRHGHGRPIAH